ncbi:Putative membrane protein insertion efficiency factor [Moorella humiferrea]|uniref:Putative membrane protein insertion efficiency factor n=2 Tax=Neomoorella humiferrea TaxID=676965 RepID=A0A2T0AS76_9FIRM|nr:putative membrane protein insertion efficiency factor [Moorella humiferrea]
MDEIVKKIMIASIRFYQIFISPVLGKRCRFYPSCSQYTIEALEKYGILQGCYLAVRRLIRCHPWHPGGYDPLR